MNLTELHINRAIDEQKSRVCHCPLCHQPVNRVDYGKEVWEGKKGAKRTV